MYIWKMEMHMAKCMHRSFTDSECIFHYVFRKASTSCIYVMYSADWWYRWSKGSLLVLHTYIYVKRNAMWTGSECARSEVNTFTKYWQMGQLLRITTSYSKKLSAYLLWVKIWNNVCIPNPKEKMSVYNSSEVEQNHSLSIEF